MTLPLIRLGPGVRHGAYRSDKRDCISRVAVGPIVLVLNGRLLEVGKNSNEYFGIAY